MKPVHYTGATQSVRHYTVPWHTICGLSRPQIHHHESIVEDPDVVTCPNCLDKMADDVADAVWFDLTFRNFEPEV